MPSRLCSYAGGRCPNDALPGGLCEKHATVRKSRDAELQKHYGRQHRKLRIQCFERDGWTCKRCGWKPKAILDWEELQQFSKFPFPSSESLQQQMTAEYRKGRRILEAHHLQDVETRPDLAADLSNYQTLCDACHAAETGGQRYR